MFNPRKFTGHIAVTSLAIMAICSSTSIAQAQSNTENEVLSQTCSQILTTDSPKILEIISDEEIVVSNWQYNFNLADSSPSNQAKALSLENASEFNFNQENSLNLENARAFSFNEGISLCQLEQPNLEITI